MCTLTTHGADEHKLAWVDCYIRCNADRSASADTHSTTVSVRGQALLRHVLMGRRRADLGSACRAVLCFVFQCRKRITLCSGFC